MSILGWLVVAVLAYFVHNAYQRIQFSRKKAEFIRDRRRAAGIPDSDKRPFAVARADALSRRSQHIQNEAHTTPIARRKSSFGAAKSQASIDQEAASRLSGIPGTLPGYLKDSASSLTIRKARKEPCHSTISPSTRSPSPIKHRNFDRSSSHKLSKRPYSQMQTSSTRKGESAGEHILEHSSSSRRDEVRRRKASATKSALRELEEDGLERPKAQRISVPGDFGTEEATITDEDMSDVPSMAAAGPEKSHTPSEAMDEDEEFSPSQADHRGRTSPERGAPLRKLQTAARPTAKKREADELEESDTEGSFDSTYDEEYVRSQTHSTKRSRKVNQELDPSSSLDFDIALPEEAMVDFDPIHADTSSTLYKASSVGSRSKRQADTSNDRQPGEEWTDLEGLRWRIHPETHELQRWSEVLERRSKYRMPRDSLHPMAKELHQVAVHKWLSKEDWEDAKAKKLLSFQEPERLAEKERLDKEEAEKMKRKLEVLAKIRQTSSPNKRIQSYLAQRQLQHKMSRGEMSGDVSMKSYVTHETNGDAASMSIDSMSMAGDRATPSKPRSRRISLQSRMTPIRGADVASVGRDGSSTSGASSPSDSPNRQSRSPLASPYRSIAYPKSKKGASGTSSPLVTSAFPASQHPSF